MGYNPRQGSSITPTTDIVAKSITLTEDVKVTDATKGVVLKDASANERRITVNADGTLTISDPLTP